MQYEDTGREGEDISNCLSEDAVEKWLWCVFACLRLIIVEYFDRFESSRSGTQIIKAQSQGFLNVAFF